MRHSFLNQLARRVVESYIYIALNTAQIPVDLRIPPLSMPNTPPIIPIEPPLIPIEDPIVAIAAPISERMFVTLPVTPPNERVTEIDVKQADELASINERSMELGENRTEAVEAIYARYMAAFPLLPELPSREPSPPSDIGAQVLESVPLTPPSVRTSPSPSPSGTFVVIDSTR